LSNDAPHFPLIQSDRNGDVKIVPLGAALYAVFVSLRTGQPEAKPRSCLHRPAVQARPAPEMLDRIAGALEIETFELFTTSISPQAELKKLHKEILANLDQAIGEAVNKAIKEQYQSNKSK